MSDFSVSYLGRLRQRVGHELLLCPGAQVLVVRQDKHVLVQRRADSGVWEIPAGACEPGQSFATAAVAELAQEAGIVAEPSDLEPFASLSDPSVHTLHYPNGDRVHAFALCFVLRVTGAAATSTDGEALEHRWCLPTLIPEPVHGPTRVVLDLFARYEQTGKFQAR
ncbi:NUDIX domain-containing protein [Nocardioides sp.]|uniref:NUDIX domain-containing protein n=1 Tax=Nocardioides sp. TaxID=35761 RepID=UPI002CF89D1B|nr:NUDIX domain-containing protein [Nocardioides sp.]HXH79569.1 NUDIX domain-containing protein [Nocardioides sp.]